MTEVICHKLDTILAAGFIEISEPPSATMPTSGKLRTLSIKYDVTLDSINAFRTKTNYWQLFLKPTYKVGFRDEPLLPLKEIKHGKN